MRTRTTETHTITNGIFRVLALVALGIALVASAVSCKGDPAKNPRIDVTTPELFNSAPDSALTVMAINFEAFTRDPDIGAKIRESMATSTETMSQSVPLWDYITYMHGIVIYSPSMLGPQPLVSGLAMVMCVEMDRPAAEKYLLTNFTRESCAGIPVFSPNEKTPGNAFQPNELFKDGVIIAVLSDTEIVYGDRASVTALLEARASGGRQTGDDALVPMGGQTMLAVSIRMSGVIESLLAARDTADMSAEELAKMEAMRKVELVQTSITIGYETCVTETAIRAPGVDPKLLEEIAGMLGSSFLLGAGIPGGGEPEVIYEPWGLRLRTTAPKENAFSGLLSTGM